MRALIVDDEASVRLVLRLKLETMGWLVEEASSGPEAHAARLVPVSKIQFSELAERLQQAAAGQRGAGRSGMRPSAQDAV